jgi:SAM-dependent methyltransferase
MTLETITGPFGPARHVVNLRSANIAAMYAAKCGVDVRGYLPADGIDLYECLGTGYRFWRPVEAAGNEEFYKVLSASWENYYSDWRWEYDYLHELVSKADTLLEIGSGRGYFLRFIESRVKSAVGLELNREAIANKCCTSDIKAQTVEQVAADQSRRFDVVCSFQVLEHIPEPESFLQACVECLKPAGRLILSTPNYHHVPFTQREDAFDLPPHHMGHFSPEVFAALAKRYGLTLEGVFLQQRALHIDAVTERTASSLPYRLFRRLFHTLGQLVYRLNREPGATVLVVMRKGGPP